MNLSEALAGLLGRPLSEAEIKRAESYLEAVSALLRARYGIAFDERLDSVRPLFDAVIAPVVARRLRQSPSGIESETSGPFSARYSSSVSGGNWFLPGELSDLDSVFGRGGSRTYRTPAPDAQRRLNRHHPRVSQSHTLGGYPVESYFESGGGEY